jgi:hypothetical protein
MLKWMKSIHKNKNQNIQVNFTRFHAVFLLQAVQDYFNDLSGLTGVRRGQEHES